MPGSGGEEKLSTTSSPLCTPSVMKARLSSAGPWCGLGKVLGSVCRGQAVFLFLLVSSAGGFCAVPYLLITSSGTRQSLNETMKFISLLEARHVFLLACVIFHFPDDLAAFSLSYHLRLSNSASLSWIQTLWMRFWWIWQLPVSRDQIQGQPVSS